MRDARQMAEAQIGEGVADMVEFKAQVSRHEASEKASRLGIQASGNIFQTGSFLTKFWPILAPGGVGSTSQRLRAQDCSRSRHAERGASNVYSAMSSRSLAKTFTRCKWIERSGARHANFEGGRWKTNLKPPQSLIGMISRCKSSVRWQISRQARQSDYCDDRES